jgi:hypothetical protein
MFRFLKPKKDHEMVDRTKEFFKALRTFAKTDDGEKVFSFLYDTYVNGTVTNQKRDLDVFYRLGQKEFVQMLIKDAYSDFDLDQIVKQNSEELIV